MPGGNRNPFEAVGGFFADAAKAAGETAGKVAGEAGKGASEVAGAAADVAGKVGKGADWAARNAANAAGKVVEEVGAAASGAAEGAGRAAEEAGKNALGVVQKIGETAVSVADDAGRTAQGAVSRARTVAGKAAGEAAGAIGEGVQAVADGVQGVAYDLKRNKYNPVFPEEYFSPGYDRPDMIVLVDGDVRKGIDVCDGAIGWFSKEGDLEVLHLYMEFVPESKVGFHPLPVLGAVYYVDTFNPKRYINIVDYFEVAKDDRMTELREIARSLGAKKCTIQLIESEKASNRFGAKAKGSLGEGKLALGSAEGQVDRALDSADRSESKVVATFTGNAEPVRPKMNWFAHDSEINFLINACFGGENANKMKNYQMTLKSRNSLAVALGMAAKIDTAIKGMKVKTGFSFESETKKEMEKSFIYSVEF
jgi:hypothetical protein